jgi:hypothetical protein
MPKCHAGFMCGHTLSKPQHIERKRVASKSFQKLALKPFFRLFNLYGKITGGPFHVHFTGVIYGCNDTGYSGQCVYVYKRYFLHRLTLRATIVSYSCKRFMKFVSVPYFIMQNHRYLSRLLKANIVCKKSTSTKQECC